MPPQAKLPPAAAYRVLRPSLKHNIATYVRDLIFNGHLQRGERIDQDAVADVFGLSKLPVREAMITLEAAALVDIIPNRGAFVSQITKDDLVDHYRIYASVEMIAAERAATKLRPDDLTRLRESITQMRNTRNGNVQEELNHEFHRIINRAGGSRRLHVMIKGMEAMMFANYCDDDSWSRNAADDHERIVDALQRGDASLAANHMHKHIVNGGALAIQMLDKRGFWAD